MQISLRFKWLLTFVLLLVLLIAPCIARAATEPPTRPDSPPRDWPAYGGGPAQMRYSPLTQINRQNVKQLQLAWTYDSHETGGMETQPIVVGNIFYGLTPTQKAFALQADTGTPIWTFNPGRSGRGVNRGLTYWADADGNDKRIFTASGRYLYALNADTGKTIPTFADNGRIDLNGDLGRDPNEQSVQMTSPGIIFKDMIIIGGRCGEGLPASPGYIRAYDVRTGKLRWIFHTIPNPGEFGYETWSRDSWTYSGGTNNWAGMAVDTQRGIVYAPTGSASADFWGGNRLGDNLFANCLLALDANTGKRIWHYQFVHHDIWDKDLPSPPSLITLHMDGRTIDAIAQTTKQGYVFVFDRKTGKPLFPIEEKKFHPSTVPGEQASPTQPIPSKPKPYVRTFVTKDMLTMRTPEVHQWALDQFAKFKGGGVFEPLNVNADTIVFPGFDGGAEWGGSAADPETGILYVNANDIAWTGGLAPIPTVTSGRSLYQLNCASCHRDDFTGQPPQFPSLVDIASSHTNDELKTIIHDGGGRMAGFPSLTTQQADAIIRFITTGESLPSTPAAAANAMPYRFTGYKKFLDPDGYPAIAPPWGTLSAINLNTGEFAWQIPLGEYPELVARGIKNTGSENYGGPIVTAGGLVFIGATNFDHKIRAFDKATGELLWEATMPFSGGGAPATYEINGRQYVAIAAGGGKAPGGSGGAYVAFALPK